MKPQMLRLVFAVAVMFPAAAASAAVHWNGPGWYQIANGDIDVYIVAGPFAEEFECRRTLPPEDDEAFYTCERHDEKPWWDGEAPWRKDEP